MKIQFHIGICSALVFYILRSVTIFSFRAEGSYAYVIRLIISVSQWLHFYRIIRLTHLDGAVCDALSASS